MKYKFKASKLHNFLEKVNICTNPVCPSAYSQIIVGVTCSPVCFVDSILQDNQVSLPDTPLYAWEVSRHWRKHNETYQNLWHSLKVPNSQSTYVNERGSNINTTGIIVMSWKIVGIQSEPIIIAKWILSLSGKDIVAKWRSDDSKPDIASSYLLLVVSTAFLISYLPGIG